MKRALFCLAFLLLIPSTPAQQKTADSSNTTQEKSGGTAATCKNLGTLAALVDGAFDGQKNETRMLSPMMTDPDDSVWDTLIGCSETTRKPSERTEALRVAAIWEWLRAAAFKKMYLEEKTAVESAKGSAAAAAAVRKSEQAYQAPQSLAEARSAVEAELQREQGEREKAQGEKVLQAALADPSILVTTRADKPLLDEEFTRISAHNRALCDQVITVTRLVSGGLVLEHGSQGGRKFLAKKYPRVCLLEDTTRFAPGVPSYLLVYSESESAYAGFQPIQKTTSSPVSGSGTVTNAYGNRWNFNYSGTLTETRTVEAPYLVQSQSIYLYAYDENGTIVSRRSITTSSQTGGDAAYAAGSNTGNLISRLWNNPKRLADNVLKDVQKDSMKYGKK